MIAAAAVVITLYDADLQQWHSEGRSASPLVKSVWTTRCVESSLLVLVCRYHDRRPMQPSPGHVAACAPDRSWTHSRPRGLVALPDRRPITVGQTELLANHDESNIWQYCFNYHLPEFTDRRAKILQHNSASYPLQMENEYWPKCGDVLRLGSKGRMAHSSCG